MDLAYTRFSGRIAPEHSGGAPHCADWAMVEGDAHELSSCGFWPGGAEGAFYAYAYPEPDGYRERRLQVPGAIYDPDLGEFVLPMNGPHRERSERPSSSTKHMRPQPNSAIGIAAHSNAIHIGGLKASRHALVTALTVRHRKRSSTSRRLRGYVVDRTQLLARPVLAQMTAGARNSGQRLLSRIRR
ncbi:DUF5996 family protein [Nocardia sp. CA-135953]|uniref:DUF5996 family protein n=1 Tax=Nocardia sp. CA-135953 TaxID=3239978 RepID=UPI003D95A2FF